MSVSNGKWSFGKLCLEFNFHPFELKVFLFSFFFSSFGVIGNIFLTFIHCFLLSFLHISYCTLPGLSTPRGLHFSEVTDSSAIVHWSMTHSPVDIYRITYVPFEGGMRSIKIIVFLHVQLNLVMKIYFR